MLAGAAAVGAMQIMRDKAAPQVMAEAAKQPAKENAVARATHMDKISQALRGE
jgi:hypothetical protein